MAAGHRSRAMAACGVAHHLVAAAVLMAAALAGKEPPMFEVVRTYRNGGRLWHRTNPPEPLGGAERTQGMLTFFHIPKNGGTTVEGLLRPYDKDGKVNSHYSYPSHHDGTQCSKQHDPPAAYVPDSFAIVREPGQRLISGVCFLQPARMKFLNGTETHTETHICAEFSRIARGYLRVRGILMDLLEVAESEEAAVDGANATTYDRVLAGGRKELKKWNLTRSKLDGCHQVPQWAYVWRAEWLVEFSALQEGITELFQRYGVSPPLTQRTFSNVGVRKPRRKFCPPASPIASGRCLELDAEVRARVDHVERFLLKRVMDPVPLLSTAASRVTA